MTALMNSCDGLVAQPSPRNREEMLTGVLALFGQNHSSLPRLPGV